MGAERRFRQVLLCIKPSQYHLSWTLKFLASLILTACHSPQHNGSTEPPSLPQPTVSVSPSWEPTPEPTPTPSPEPSWEPAPELWGACPQELKVGFMADMVWHEESGSFWILSKEETLNKTAEGLHEVYKDNHLYTLQADKTLAHYTNKAGQCLNPALKIAAIEPGPDEQIWLLIRWSYEGFEGGYRILILDPRHDNLKTFADIALSTFDFEFLPTSARYFALDAKNATAYISSTLNSATGDCEYHQIKSSLSIETFHRRCSFYAFAVRPVNESFYVYTSYFLAKESGAHPNHLKYITENIPGFNQNGVNRTSNAGLLINENTFLSTLQDRITTSDFEQLQIQSIAGGSTPGFQDGPAEQARFNYPTGLALDKAGNLFIVDALNFALRKLDRSSNQVSTLYVVPENARETLSRVDYRQMP